MREFQVECIDAQGATYSISIQAGDLLHARRIALRDGHQPSSEHLSLNPEIFTNSEEDEFDSIDKEWDKESRSVGRTVVIAMIVVVVATAVCALVWRVRGGAQSVGRP